jgi:hypothetical protein
MPVPHGGAGGIGVLVTNVDAQGVYRVDVTRAIHYTTGIERAKAIVTARAMASPRSMHRRPSGRRRQRTSRPPSRSSRADRLS